LLSKFIPSPEEVLENKSQGQIQGRAGTYRIWEKIKEKMGILSLDKPDKVWYK
jgi:hypothetical protein